LYEAEASAADFTGANLNGSKMGRVRLVRAVLDGAKISEARAHRRAHGRGLAEGR